MKSRTAADDKDANKFSEAKRVNFHFRASVLFNTQSHRGENNGQTFSTNSAAIAMMAIFRRHPAQIFAISQLVREAVAEQTGIPWSSSAESLSRSRICLETFETVLDRRAPYHEYGAHGVKCRKILAACIRQLIANMKPKLRGLANCIRSLFHIDSGAELADFNRHLSFTRLQVVGSRSALTR
ncbi:hypothetical protein H6P81_021273 [Aristolochia fimbriata]|uniref:Uncharacterized protein n=1 Tax=Aristolochia fimbriata TaxID=158543 RepID=A0AAV7DRE4_ARIFI|nr:hypothetical protein H6P81_021273 [Aristolochia fimbriata]